VPYVDWADCYEGEKVLISVCANLRADRSLALDRLHEAQKTIELLKATLAAIRTHSSEHSIWVDQLTVGALKA
jgi:hypothetical protein